MKILVATKDQQGRRKNDFCHAVEGEIVSFVSECDGEAVDGQCGCRRAMSGLTSHQSTTTFKCVDLPITVDELKGKVKDGLGSGGWLEGSTPNEVKEWVADDSQELMRIADSFRIGDIVEKRGDTYRSRSLN